MSLSVKNVSDLIEQWAPLAYAEDFDNVGLLVGDPSQKVNGVLVTLDTTEEVIDEAVSKKCNLIVSFHPIVFSGLKKITGKSYVERTVIKAIQNDIAIYCIHTALDNQADGVSKALSDAIGLTDTQVLIPQKNTIKKLRFYVPNDHVQKVQNALFDVGAGRIGQYDQCSFVSEGIGGFRALEEALPFVGTHHQRHHEPETQVQLVFEKHIEQHMVQVLKKVHPYQEVAYEILSLDNTSSHIGMGLIGTLKKPLKEISFLTRLKNRLGTPLLRHSKTLNNPIHSVAVLGGSGSFAIPNAIALKADAYVTSDLKYHDFFTSASSILLVDVGHYESEQFTKNILVKYLIKKMPNFAIVLSETKTNPVQYF